MTLRIIRAFHENQPFHTEPGRLIELPFRRGNALRVFEPVFIADESNINIRLLQFAEIDLIGFLVGGGNIFFENKDTEKAGKRRIGLDELFQPDPLCGELFLDTADENSLFHTLPLRSVSVRCRGS